MKFLKSQTLRGKAALLIVGGIGICLILLVAGLLISKPARAQDSSPFAITFNLPPVYGEGGGLKYKFWVKDSSPDQTGPAILGEFNSVKHWSYIAYLYKYKSGSKFNCRLDIGRHFRADDSQWATDNNLATEYEEQKNYFHRQSTAGTLDKSRVSDGVWGIEASLTRDAISDEVRNNPTAENTLALCVVVSRSDFTDVATNQFVFHPASPEDTRAGEPAPPKPKDTTPPIIRISVNGSVVSASTTAADVNATSWKYFVTTTNPVCSSSRNNYSGSGRTVTLTATQRQSQQYICFKVSDKNGNTGYGERAVAALVAEPDEPDEVTPPAAEPAEEEPEEPVADPTVIKIDYSISEDGSTLTPSAMVTSGTATIDANSWRFVRDLSSETECTDSIFTDQQAETPTEGSVKLTEADQGKYICLRVGASDQQTALRAAFVEQVKADDDEADSSSEKPTSDTDEGDQDEDKDTDDEGSGMLIWWLIGAILVVVIGVVIVAVMKKRNDSPDL